MSDTVALDFLNSLAGAGTRDRDRLVDGASFLEWLKGSGLVPVTALNVVRTEFASTELDAAAAAARSLREWFREFVCTHKGREVGDTALPELQRLNALLERDDIYSQLVPIDPEGSGFGLQVRRRWHSPESLLVAIAQALAGFVCNADFAQVRMCEAPGCNSILADDVREAAPRWCRWCHGSS
jgi:predicted RNA-binding Zn ribbon-like protein